MAESHRPRLTPDERQAKAEAFMQAHFPAAELESLVVSEGLTRAVYVDGRLLIGFKWRVSIGTLGFKHVEAREDFWSMPSIAVALGWCDAMPMHMDEELELAASHAGELKALFSDQAHETTARQIGKFWEDRQNHELSPCDMPVAARPVPLLAVIRQGLADFISELRLWVGPKAASPCEADRQRQLKDRLKAKRQSQSRP